MKLNKTIIISDIISILIAFALFIWIFIEMKCVAIVYDRILNNLFIKDFNPIQKINLRRTLCQEKGMFSLINYTFPGIPESCYDIDSKQLEDCGQKNKNLSKIEKINKKNFTIWRNKVFCGKYFEYDNSSYKFIKDEDNDDGEDCGEEYKKCGTINSESKKEALHKIVCVKKDIECPLNFIEITNDITQYKDSNNYNILPFENNYYLVTSNKITSNGIITKIRIAEGDFPCYERDRYSNTTAQFPNLINIENFNCTSTKVDEKPEEKGEELRALIDEDEEDGLIKQGFDIRYKQFDTRLKSDVLFENDLDYAYSRLPNLSNWDQDMYKSNFHLFYLNSFIVKEECTEFDTLESNIKKLKYVQASRVVFALFHILIYVLLFSILGLIKVILAWRHSMLFGIKVGLSFIIFGINFALIYYSEKYIGNLSNFHSLEDCLDEVSKAILYNHDIDLILNELKDFYFWEKIVWYFYVFFNFIEACRLVHKIYIRCKNTYRRNIANNEIGADNLKKIFEKVRNELEKKKEK
jgi:hypothetical protein